ncbi:MYND-type domain-containing protein [Caerostris extrusa]|uniref:MYND-type domain-containing protein n=1 Tax=Caerostris extrusa TaxID=172846 RepID=A0AAV4RI59_CAEEX|nr:MYND-type domain-containing protein [Caerostris extrusa]
MNEPVYKRVAFSSLSQHVGKPVTVLGEFDQLEPNGKKFTMKVSSNHIVTIQLQEPMRALKLRHDDGELFDENLDTEKKAERPFEPFLGKPDLEDEIPVPLMGFVCTIYFEFISALICLLKKWVHEPDLSEEDLNKIDYTVFYWKPRNHWEEPNFVPTCFDKYLATYWKDDLPKMLLTCDIHNTFNNHEIHNCCDYAKDMNIFELFRDKIIMTPQFVIQHCSLIQPISESCPVHTDCRTKIIHSSECAEPYLCEGSKICSITCEKSSVKQQNFSRIDETNPWKNISVEIFTCVESNKRSVSTLAQSQFDDVETFLSMQRTMPVMYMNVMKISFVLIIMQICEMLTINTREKNS